MSNSLNVADAETAEKAIYRLQEINELLASDKADDEAALMSYLGSDNDLCSALQRHDAQLRDELDSFIQLHVEQAEEICRVYNDFSNCEDQLVDFETAIVSFQRNLGQTADDIVLMQHHSDRLVCSIAHRRQVSNMINEVYGALQGCESFCEEMVSNDVDAHYLSNLLQLERSLSFLSKNKALQGSAVDNEIRPKLTAAAHKAGNKLRLYLSQQIALLADGVGDLENKQQVLEQVGQFAYSFLHSYNEPVARELLMFYCRTMSAVYHKQFGTLLHDLSEATEIHAQPLDPMVLYNEVVDFLSNRDAGSPTGWQVVAPALTYFPGRTLACQPRNASPQHMRDPTGLAASSSRLRTLREATFADTFDVLQSLNVWHGKIQSDPDSAAQLEQCNSWTWRFVKCLQALVNTCAAECHFIGNFFYPAGDLDDAQDFNESEKVARAVLSGVIRAVEFRIQEDMPLVMDRTVILAALRAIEVMKQFLCTFQDPIPLLLLSGILEISKTCLKSNLHAALQNDSSALGYLAVMQLTAFRQALLLANADTERLLQDRAYVAILGPHPILLRISKLLAQLELLNTTTFRCFMGSDTNTAIAAYDSHVNTFIDAALERLLDFVDVLAQRHSSVLAQRFFSSINIFYIAVQFQLKNSFPATLAPSTSEGTNSLSASAPPHFLRTEHVRFIEERFGKALSGLVEVDAEVNGTFHYIFSFDKEIKALLGTEFFSSNANQRGDVDAALAAEGLPDTAWTMKALEVVSMFHTHWKDHLASVVDNVSRAVQAILGSGSSTVDPSQAVRQHGEELTRSILRVYYQFIVDANVNLCLFTRRACSEVGEAQIKLVSNTVVMHEMSKTISY